LGKIDGMNLLIRTPHVGDQNEHNYPKRTSLKLAHDRNGRDDVRRLLDLHYAGINIPGLAIPNLIPAAALR